MDAVLWTLMARTASVLAETLLQRGMLRLNESKKTCSILCAGVVFLQRGMLKTVCVGWNVLSAVLAPGFLRTKKDLG